MAPNRVALVTGAAGGLGTAIAAGLAKAGFRLALLDRAPLPPAHPAFDLPESDRMAGSVDIADLRAVGDAIRRISDGLGEPAVLVNAAGLGPPFADPGIFKRPVDLTTVDADPMAPPVAWLCSAVADAVTGRRLVASGWVDPPAGAAAETVGSPIGWPQLAGKDRTVPMAGAFDRPVRASGS